MNISNPSTSDLDDLFRGFLRDRGGACRCLFCPEYFEEGRVYEIDSRLFLAERAAALHVESAHGGAFAALAALGGEAAGLPEIQARVLSLLYEGKSDAEIASALGGKSASTVRNHRFQLRRRESEARVFLALMKLLDEKGAGARQFIEYPAGAGSEYWRT